MCVHEKGGRVGLATRELRKTSSSWKLLTQYLLFPQNLGIYSLYFYAWSSLFPSFLGDGGELRFHRLNLFIKNPLAFDST